MSENERAELLEEFATYEQTRRRAQTEDIEILVRAYSRLFEDSRDDLWQLVFVALLKAAATTFYATRSPSDEQMYELERKLVSESMPRLPDFIEDARGCGLFVDSIEERLGESVFRSSDRFGWLESPQIIDDYRALCREHYQLMSVDTMLDTQTREEAEIRIANLIHDFQIQWRKNLFEQLLATTNDRRGA